MNISRIFRRAINSAVLLTLLGRTASAETPTLVYFGTMSGKKGTGIYVSRLDRTSGQLSAPELAAETASPGFLAIHPSQPFLFSVGEMKNATRQPSGAVNAWAIDPKTGKLSFLNQESSGGIGPAHLTVDKTGNLVLVANYGSGSVSAIPIHAGHLGRPTAFQQHAGSSINPHRQREPHAHSVNVDPANRFAFVADLGVDAVMIYKFDSKTGTLIPNNPREAAVEPGSGPRHLAFHPSARFAYVINEMLCTITAFAYDAKTGQLKTLQTISTLPAGQAVEPSFSTAEVQVHPSGKFLYGSNRGHDTIAAFAIDEQTGQLSLLQHESTQGKIPRNFGVDPNGEFLLAANQNSDSVVVFRIDAKSGRIAPTGQKVEVPSPVCVKFLMPPMTQASR